MEILGVRIDNVKMRDTLDKVRDFLADGRQHYIVTVNPEFIVIAQKDKEFLKILNNADLAVPDGSGLVWASRLAGEGFSERVTGVDLIENCRLKIKDLKIFLLGGRNGVAEKIATAWPAVIGFSEETEGPELFARINQCQPNFLLLALGAPNQEKWIVQNLPEVPSVRVAIGVGGAFDMLSGRISRAPSIMQKIGLEWLWRLLKQPSRFSRIFNSVIIFPWLVLRSNKK
jgi:N-acetylglucosaminyldiphosphoundecaprenol N-acetyl-beta-D-mannosaminyltransferase